MEGDEGGELLRRGLIHALQETRHSRSRTFSSSRHVVKDISKPVAMEMLVLTYCRLSLLFASFFFILGPLDRGCQKLIFPACKNLGIYQHTLFSESVQKKFYKWLYNRTYDGGDLEAAFPKNVEKELSKFPKCQTNIKKLFCGELFPPCFPDEGSPVFKTLCSSVCNDIIRDCPAYFR